jgi:hypothetical protein
MLRKTLHVWPALSPLVAVMMPALVDAPVHSGSCNSEDCRSEQKTLYPAIYAQQLGYAQSCVFGFGCMHVWHALPVSVTML